MAKTIGWMSPGWLQGLFFIAGLILAGTVHPQEVGVAAVVNGIEISNFRLERYFEDFLKERGRNLGTIRNPQAYKRLRKEALERLIDRELLVQEAARRGIEAPVGEVEALKARIVGGYKTRETFLRRLGDAGFTEDSFYDYLRRDLMARRALVAMVVEEAVTPVPEAGRTIEPGRPPAAETHREVEARVLQNLRTTAQIKVLLPL